MPSRPDIDDESALIAADFLAPGKQRADLAARIALFVRFIVKRTSSAQQIADLGTAWSIAGKDDAIKQLSDASELKTHEVAEMKIRTTAKVDARDAVIQALVTELEKQYGDGCPECQSFTGHRGHCSREEVLLRGHAMIEAVTEA